MSLLILLGAFATRLDDQVHKFFLMMPVNFCLRDLAS
jgi:hypothetical protein